MRQAAETSNGFTLIELITVLAIVAVLAGLTTTGFVMSVQARSTDHFVKELTGYLRFIQFKAIEEAKIHKLIIQEPGGTLTVLAESGAAREFQPVDNLFAKRFEREKHFSVRFHQGGEIYFFPDGVVSRNQLVISDETGERAAIEVKNRIGAFKVTINE